MRERQFKILQQQAYDHIKNGILDQSFQYDQIYSESKLSLEIGISRTPVRDAVHRLYQEGLIDIIPNKGFILHKITNTEMMENQEIRSAIEGYCSRQAAISNSSGPVRNLLTAMETSLDKQQEIYESTSDVFQFTAEDQHFHFLLVTYNNNETFLDIYNQCIYKTKRLASYSLKSEGRMLHTLHEHRDIYQAIREGNPQQAYDAVILHMQAPLSVYMQNSGLEPCE